MPRWLRIIRGMVGTGLTFAFGVGAVSGLVGLAGILFSDFNVSVVLGAIGRISVAGFVLGLVVSAGVALVGRTRSFDRLSLKLVSAIGAGGGLLYFAAISTNGIGVWDTQTMLVNLVGLVGTGALAAAGMLLVARRATRGSATSDEPEQLMEGSIEDAMASASREKAREQARR